MSALLAVGYVIFFAGSNQYAMVLRRGVGEEFHSANRDFVDFGDLSRWERGSLGQERFHQNPEIADEHTEAGEGKKFRELATRYVALIAREHGEFVFPERLLTGAAKKRHTTPPTCSPEHRAKQNPPQREPSCVRG